MSINGGVILKRGLCVKRKKIYTIAIVILALIMVYVGSNFSNGRLTVQGSNNRHGVYFMYEGIEYQVFIIKQLGEDYNASDITMCIPDEDSYNILEDKTLIEKYDLWTGYCDCYKRKDSLNGEITVTMNMYGTPEEYSFNLFRYDERDVKEVVYLLDEKGVHGYGFATSKLTKDKEK